MMVDERTDKVVIASDIRNKIKNYKKGALGNYATAFGVVAKKRSSDIMELAGAVDHEVRSIIGKPDREMLILSCYFNMDPELLDAVAISTLGGFESKTGRFVGSRMFGYEKRDGHCITNLGRIESNAIREGVFIPPASPANTMAWVICLFTGFSLKYDADNITGEVLAISIILAVVSIALSILIGLCSGKIKNKIKKEVGK